MKEAKPTQHKKAVFQIGDGFRFGIGFWLSLPFILIVPIVIFFLAWAFAFALGMA